MDKNFLSLYEQFKSESYELTSIEFEILQAKLKLTLSLNDKQLNCFEEYDKLISLFVSKKEFQFLQFVIKQLQIEQK